MSRTKSIETALTKSAHIVEGILLDLKCQSELNEVTADTWSNAINVINGELSVVCRLLQNVTGEIWLSQQWPALLEVRLMRDGINAHPWSHLHLLTAPKASSARALSIKVINEARPLSTAVTATAPPAVKVEQVGKGKERAAIEEVGEDAGQEVTVKMVAKEAKGKGKAKEVGEERAVNQGKGKGKGKEVVQEEGVVEQTTETEKSKNKGKWRESSKGTKKTRGHSQSTATSKFKSAELVPSGSEDKHTGLTPRGPSLTPSSVQPWPASTPQSQAPTPQKSTVERHGLRGWSVQATQRKAQWGGHSPPIPLFFMELRRSMPTQPQA
ncbi:hypothetical protein PAXRUDRAFT_22213 [Paxillus rubicundulus Ve08.2h10]|uniref:Uncharacterized protein n=1 Tax=Paxillus rubicundulus Ve08.2h10 TaxID=930991 RepID=A0A0D0BKP4_9AGAM|nr:hypothetical protein PAXRUDRAFT_22213 [Paxillus rubicundulus Ve08.2h10]